jgi:hypothetical protein
VTKNQIIRQWFYKWPEKVNAINATIKPFFEKDSSQREFRDINIPTEAVDQIIDLFSRRMAACVKLFGIVWCLLVVLRRYSLSNHSGPVQQDKRWQLILKDTGLYAQLTAILGFRKVLGQNLDVDEVSLIIGGSEGQPIHHGIATGCHICDKHEEG